jgi:hypothetical protein
MAENKSLKDRLAQQSALITQEGGVGVWGGVRRENEKLREINRKLKRYAGILEGEIKAVCRIDECESHRACVSSLIEQKNYFCDMLTRENSLIETAPVS